MNKNHRNILKNPGTFNKQKVPQYKSQESQKDVDTAEETFNGYKHQFYKRYTADEAHKMCQLVRKNVRVLKSMYGNLVYGDRSQKDAYNSRMRNHRNTVVGRASLAVWLATKNYIDEQRRRKYASKDKSTKLNRKLFEVCSNNGTFNDEGQRSKSKSKKKSELPGHEVIYINGKAYFEEPSYEVLKKEYDRDPVGFWIMTPDGKLKN